MLFFFFSFYTLFKDDLIYTHNLNYHLYIDNSQEYFSTPRPFLWTLYPYILLATWYFVFMSQIHFTFNSYKLNSWYPSPLFLRPRTWSPYSVPNLSKWLHHWSSYTNKNLRDSWQLLLPQPSCTDFYLIQIF